MKILDIIKNFFNNIKVKRLSSSHLVETSVIPIYYDGKYGENFASFIKDEINHYKDFYKVFLDEYDGICIGDNENEFNNPLKIENSISKFEWKTSENNELRARAVNKLQEYFGSKYVGKDVFYIFYKMKSEYDSNEIEYTYDKKKEDEAFYYFIIQGKKIQYENELCRMKDWESLKMLLESKSNEEFIEKYTEKNLSTILNKAVEMYTDHDCNDFFEKNIETISEAIELTKEQFSTGFVKSLDDLLKEVIKNSDEKDIKPEEKENIENENEFTKENIISITQDILKYIDDEGRLNSFFDEKMLSGKILLSEDLNEEPKYKVKEDLCKVPLKGQITDIPIIIHEFIHQYYYNNSKTNLYSTEIPSIYFEKVAIEYLINNGYQSYKNMLDEYFIDRKENDAVNNMLSINTFINTTKIKRNKGELTIDNIMTDEQADKANKTEFLLGIPKVKEISDIEGRKRIFAKDVIKTFANRNRKELMTNRVLCSYALGTYFAEKYCNDSSVSQEMLKLICNPEYSLQDLINNIVRATKIENKSVGIKRNNKEREKDDWYIRQKGER